MKFFEDLVVGERREIGRHIFGADEIKAFARKYDPQPFHTDEAAAERSHFKRLVASGWHTSAICMRFVVADKDREDGALRSRGQPVAASGPSPGVRDVRWIKPVYAGDTITFTTEVKEKRDTSRRGYGLLVSANTGTNQHGDVVYSVQGAVFVERRIK
ncbi:MAG TPA: MaoC family dehydratase [Xanthobacteraceae bacterium]|jgi:acyl dehydratase|nr:MaoC family dehydratase [Xanthobacteraceae bacterium]